MNKKKKLWEGLCCIDASFLKCISQHNDAPHSRQHINCYFPRVYGRPSPNIVLQFFDEDGFKIECVEGTHRLKIMFVKREKEFIYLFKFYRFISSATLYSLSMTLKSPDTERVVRAEHHICSTVYQQDNKSYVNFYLEEPHDHNKTDSSNQGRSRFGANQTR